MTNLVIYDSKFGNTKKVAEVVARVINAKILSVADATSHDIANIDLLIIGSPTHGGHMTQKFLGFFDQLPRKVFDAIKVASFDTRLSEKYQNFALRLLIKTIGYAATRIRDSLKERGVYLLSRQSVLSSKTGRGRYMMGSWNLPKNGQNKFT